MKNRTRLLMKIAQSSLDNEDFANSDKEIIEQIIKEIDTEYIAPNNSVVSQKALNEGVRAAGALNDLSKDDLESIRDLLKDIDFEKVPPGTTNMSVDDAGLVFSSLHQDGLLKKAYLSNLISSVGKEEGLKIYKSSASLINMEIVKRSSDDLYMQKYSFDFGQLGDKVSDIARDALVSSKNSIKWVGGKLFKSLPFIGLAFSLYMLSKEFIKAKSVWDSEFERYSQMGSIEQISDPKYLETLYESTDDLTKILDITKLIKASREFNQSFILSLVYFIDSIENIVTFFMNFTIIGALVEMALSLGFFIAGEGYAESRAEEFTIILNKIKNDMNARLNNSAKPSEPLEDEEFTF